MMKNKLLYVKTLVVSGVLMITSCTSDNEQQGMITYDVRNAIDHASMLNLDQEITDVHYVPLEMTDDDESLIDGILDYAVTTKYIYVLPAQETRVVLFDRKGNFIKTLIKEGQGPSEFSGLLTGLQADEKSDRLYLGLGIFFGRRIY